MTDQFLWANPQVLVDLGYEEEAAISGVVSASWLMWALSGRHLHTEGTKTDTFELVPGGRLKINLSTFPVKTVTEVRLLDVWSSDPASGVAMDTENWRQVGSSVRFTRFSTGPGWVRAADPRLVPNGALVAVDYTVADNLPPTTDQVVLLLAEEYCKAAAGRPCKLPDRITSVSRQGITWTVLDPADFLNRGRTGIIRVDTWLSAANPGRNRSKARIFDPAMPKLISSIWVYRPWTHTIIDSLGNDTFTGHGPPPATGIAASIAGDTYVDLDTGIPYLLT